MFYVKLFMSDYKCNLTVQFKNNLVLLSEQVKNPRAPPDGQIMQHQL